MSEFSKKDEGEKANEEVVTQKESEVEDYKCAICYTSEYEILNMPCCHRESSSIHYCQRCLEIICRRSQSGVGRCPGCRAKIGLENLAGKLTIVRKANRRGICRMCCGQDKEIVGEGFCGVCLYGQRFSFRYICHKCNRVQRIPHPMYRYQQSPDELSSASWACHVACNEYTHWRIHPDDLSSVPFEDMPESWERGEEFLDAVRQIRLQEFLEGKESSDS